VHLVRLNLNENKLKGALPREIAELTDLEYLELSDNDFSGALPDSLSEMEQLMSLRINGARGGLGGSLPAFQECHRLEELELVRTTTAMSLCWFKRYPISHFPFRHSINLAEQYLSTS